MLQQYWTIGAFFWIVNTFFILLSSVVVHSIHDRSKDGAPQLIERLSVQLRKFRIFRTWEKNLRGMELQDMARKKWQNLFIRRRHDRKLTWLLLPRGQASNSGKCREDAEDIPQQDGSGIEFIAFFSQYASTVGSAGARIKIKTDEENTINMQV